MTEFVFYSKEKLRKWKQKFNNTIEQRSFAKWRIDKARVVCGEDIHYPLSSLHMDFTSEEREAYKRQQIESYTRQQEASPSLPTSTMQSSSSFSNLAGLQSRNQIVEAVIQGTDGLLEQKQKKENNKLEQQVQILVKSIDETEKFNEEMRKKINELERAMQRLLQEKRALEDYMNR